MAILKNCELYWVKCDPTRPDGRFDKNNPQWSVQLRTKKKAQKAEWEAAGLPVKAHMESGEDTDGVPTFQYWKATLSKKSKKHNPDKKVGGLLPAVPIRVISGDLEDLNPNTVGNGSIGNVTFMTRDYLREGDATPKVAVTLTAIQVTHHIVYVPPVRDEFAKCEYTATPADTSKADDAEDELAATGTEAKPKTGFEDMDDDIPY